MMSSPAVDSILAALQKHKAGTLNPKRDTLDYSLTPDEYKNLLGQLQNNHTPLGRYVNDKVRYEYNPATTVLALKMQTAIHEAVGLDTVAVILAQLQTVAAVNRITNLGSRSITLLDGSIKSPDASFYNRQKSPYPVAVVEVAYSQTSKNLKQSAHNYIQYSAGDICSVLTLDIQYPKAKSVIVQIHRVSFDVESKKFRCKCSAPQIIHADAQYQAESIDLTVKDFAGRIEASDSDLSKPITILHSKLASILNDAQSIAEATARAPQPSEYCFEAQDDSSTSSFSSTDEEPVLKLSPKTTRAGR